MPPFLILVWARFCTLIKSLIILSWSFLSWCILLWYLLFLFLCRCIIGRNILIWYCFLLWYLLFLLLWWLFYSFFRCRFYLWFNGIISICVVCKFLTLFFCSFCV